MRRWIRLLLNVAAGVLSFIVMGWGLYSVMSVDLRMNPVLSILYCALAILSFPLDLVIWLLHKPTWWLAVAACAYLVVYSALDWRSCSAMGICGGVAETVWITIKTRPVLAFIGAVVCASIAEWFGRAAALAKTAR